VYKAASHASCTDAMYCYACRPFRGLSACVSVCMLGTQVSRAKMAEPIGADFRRAMVATAPGGKAPHRAPPCEELDPATLAVNDTDGNAVRYQACFVQKIKSVCRKINKICCHLSCTF